MTTSETLKESGKVDFVGPGRGRNCETSLQMKSKMVDGHTFLMLKSLYSV